MGEFLAAEDMSHWMSKLPATLWDKSLSEIVIPGSHHSYSYSLDPASELAPDAALKLVGNAVLYKWAVTQHLSFTEQLELGVRYFDLRIAFRKKTKQIHFNHSIYGMTVEYALKEIMDFLNEHPKEIAILDFNHYYEMTDELHSELICKLNEICGDKLCLFVGFESLTLNILWENKFQAIILYHHSIASDSCNLWPGQSCVQAPWANTPNIPRLFEFLTGTHDKRRPDAFHVTQCVLTPDAGFILGHLTGNLKNEMAKKVMPEALNWLKEKGRKVNIVIADFVELNNFVKDVVMLNFKE